MSDVPGEKIDGATVAEHSYMRAVYAYAKADLVERMADFDLTGAGQKKVDWLDTTPDEQRRNAAWAISTILGRSRCTVDLV
ncbi:Phage head completion protein (GPL) [compost metagenome]